MNINLIKENSICVFDVDDTLLKSNSKIRFIQNGVHKELSTEEFAKIRKELGNIELDLSDFRDGEKVYNHLMSARPHLPGLAFLDYAVNQGIKIGILTNRGPKNVIWKAMNQFLKYKNYSTNKIEKLPKHLFKKKYVYSVYDSKMTEYINKNYPNATDDVKYLILKDFFLNRMKFNKIYFFDDDTGNIDHVKKSKDKRIEAILIK